MADSFFLMSDFVVQVFSVSLVVFLKPMKQYHTVSGLSFTATCPRMDWELMTRKVSAKKSLMKQTYSSLGAVGLFFCCFFLAHISQWQ